MTGDLAPVTTKLALWTYVAETEEEARKGAQQFMVEYSDSTLRHYELIGSHFTRIKGYETYAATQAKMTANKDEFLQGFFESHPCGTPQQVIDRSTQLAEAFGTNEIMFVFKYGSMPIEEAQRSMRLFANEVMPALQALDPKPLEVVLS